MATHVSIKGIKYWFNDAYLENLENQKKLIIEKFDNTELLCGMEGYGKTDFAVQSLHYLTEGRFTVDDIVFSIDEFEAWVDDPARRPGDGVLWDEFVLAGMSQDALKGVQIKLIKKLTMMRKYRFHIFLVIPYIWLLRKFFAVGRARNCIVVKPKDHNALKRGEFDFYNYKVKKKLYVRGLKTWEVHTAPTFSGNFGRAPRGIIDWDTYEERKNKAIELLGEEKEGMRLQQVQAHRVILIRALKHYLKQKEIAKLMGVGEATVSRLSNLPSST